MTGSQHCCRETMETGIREPGSSMVPFQSCQSSVILNKRILGKGRLWKPSGRVSMKWSILWYMNAKIVAGDNELFSSVKRKEFQMAHAWKSDGKILLGWRDIIHHQWPRGPAGSSSKCHKALVNFPYIFLVLGKGGVTEIIQPIFLILLGLEWSPPTNQSLSHRLPLESY